MPSLLTLPRELRDDMIDYVVRSYRRSPPIVRDEGDSNGAERIQFKDTHWKDIGNLIYFEKLASAFQPTFGGLLLASKQLRAETLERASRINIPHVLDLLIVNDEKIWVTWLSMPEKTSLIIEELKINVRFQGAGYYAPVSRTFINVSFGVQLRNLLYRILAIACSGPLPNYECQQLFLGARYKFENTIRFEKEYIPRHAIRKLIYTFTSDGNDVTEVERFKELLDPHQESPEHEPWVTQQPYVYAGEWASVLEEITIYNAIFTSREHPGWKTLSENLGGFQIFCNGELMAERLDLGQIYAETLLGRQDLADRIQAERMQGMLALREDNGLY
ncbi:hypothetical protein N0V90_011553 [Kalmusia sp. IMI 367209]|nr:hypothetical protein N0V90_011553 [Kalmusia sp. IMI 367209]